MFNLFKRLWASINLQRKFQISFLLLLMVLAAFAELITISAVVPFISILTSPETILNNQIANAIFNMFGMTSIDDLRNALTLIFISLIILAGLLRFLLLYFQTRLSFSIGADFARSMYYKTLFQPFVVHLSRNSSEVVSTIMLKANALATSALLPLLTLISSSIILIFILIAIVLVDPLVSVLVFSSFSFAYLIISFLTKRRLDIASAFVNKKLDGLIKALQEGLGGIRDIIIDNLQKAYMKDFEKAHYVYRQSAGNIHIIASGPRYAIEAIGMIVIIMVALSMIGEGAEQSISSGIPILAVFALGAQKLFPILQGMFASFATIRGGFDSMQAVLDLYDQELPDEQEKQEPICFKDKISLKNISFSYSKDEPRVLKNINIEFNKGERIGVIGETGSGKSTLMDILMGLISPSEGSLYIDNCLITPAVSGSWHRHISHVPQSIYLIDASIAANIAFGISSDKIDIERVKEAANKANISQTIESLDQGYFTKVGERGVRMSGGQLQRIGIARALYKETNVIILDEATSALDVNTENQVMDAINDYGNNLTLFIVAHRVTTLKDCTKIIKLEDGKISYIGSYEDIPK